MLFTSGLDNLTNDFPLHPAFVPFVEQTARYLSGSERPASARSVDSFFDLRTSREQEPGRTLGVEVIDPDGHRPLSLNEAATTQSLRLTRAGFYQVRLANGREDVVGVNPDRRESNLDVMPDDVLALWRGSPKTPDAAVATDGRLPQEREAFSTVVVHNADGTDGGAGRVVAGEPVSGHSTRGIFDRRGTMNARQELNSYLTQLEQRLRLGTLSRGAAIVVGAALGTTIALALALSVSAFSDGSITGARLVLFVVLAAAAVFGLGIPFSRLTRVRAARRAEEVFPGFQQRLETFVDKTGRRAVPRAACR